MWNTLSNEPDVWDVSELTRYIRELFEIDFRLQEVQVRGELSNVHPARSGHLYFTLKDENSQIRCVMWSSQVKQLSFEPQSGDAVMATGRVSVYEAGGQYQLYAERLWRAGVGDLAAAFEAVKNRLAEEGLFDASYKKPIPNFPKSIGLVTSLDAAALRDVMNVLRRRYPLVNVVIAPTLVQGPGAPGQVIEALRRLDSREDIDTIIITRGGGSLEDLAAFNDEGVARAIFEANHPIISGVGHETDFTLTDFVADLRAPTPSAAAELAVPDGGELLDHIDNLALALDASIMDLINEQRLAVTSLQRHLGLLSPRARLDSARQRLDSLTLRLEQGAIAHQEQQRTRLALLQARLRNVSPLQTLARGYAIVRSEGGGLVRQRGDVEIGDVISVRVRDGEFEAEVRQDAAAL
jgi:exodeoxyribonuclease VII large subunit